MNKSMHRKKDLEYCAVKKVFCKNYVRKRWKTTQKSKKSQKFSKTSKRFQLLPNASQWVRMDPKASKSSRKPQKTCENFEKLRKNFEKLREKFYKNFFHGVVCPFAVTCSSSSRAFSHWTPFSHALIAALWIIKFGMIGDHSSKARAFLTTSWKKLL